MTKKLFAAVLALGMAAAAQAAPTYYFGEDQNPGNSVVAGRAPATARAAFLGNLASTVSTQTFESFAVGSTAPLNLSFTGSGPALSATLTSPPGLGQINNTSDVGRFNTTGATAGPAAGKWWDSTGPLTITFATAISAFGFYGSDIGDVNGKLTVDLTDIAGVVTQVVVNNTQNGNDGSLLFWGFVDGTNSYTKIAFGNTSGGADGFGFDDMVIGDRGQIVTVPEPGSLALVGLALAGLAAASRRRTRD